MIVELFVGIRLVAVFTLTYLFFYQYLFNKYQAHLKEFDDFNWRNRFGPPLSLQNSFNFTQKQINGSMLSDSFATIARSHSLIGSFKEFDSQNEIVKNYSKITEQSTNSNLFSRIKGFLNKKVDSYQFNFYNWYRFQFTFTDVHHDSYMEFRMIEIKKGSHEIVQKIGFRLPQNFYPLKRNDNKNSLNINFESHGISLKVSQFIVPQHYNDTGSDGLQQDEYFYLSSNKTQVTQQDYRKFGSAKTLTQFNFTFLRKDYEIRGHATHVIRHNQCVTNQWEGVLRHKCMGGYGKGKLSFSQFIRKDINVNQKRYTGNWQRNSYNLDNTRVRTTFIGTRQTINFAPIQHLSQLRFLNPVRFQPSAHFKSLEIDFIGFNKLEYYSKKDKIQKERWIGMSLYSVLDEKGAPLINSIHQNYFFINGNIHPIYNMDFLLSLTSHGLENGQIIVFSHNASTEQYQKTTPSFKIQFKVSNSTFVTENDFLGEKQIYRVDGYWKGWIDQGTLFKNQALRQHYNSTYEYGYAEFYEIIGTIKFVQQIKQF